MQIEVTPWKLQLRILKSTNLNRHLSRSILSNHYCRHSISTFLPPSNNHINPRFPSCRIKCASLPSLPPPISNPFSLLLSLSATHHFKSRIPDDRVGSDTDDNCFSWNRAPPVVNGGDLGGAKKDKGPLYTVVMLGWLGSEQKHLKRYIELYTSKGIHSLSFVVPVRDVLGFDLGRRVENRILALANELISWLSESEEDGRERALIFHTFSNTGWLVYGAILDYLQSRSEFIDKIKGCVVDSGADPELNPQVQKGIVCQICERKCKIQVCTVIHILKGSNTKLNKGRKFLKCQHISCIGFQWLDNAIKEVRGSVGSSSTNSSYNLQGCFLCGSSDHWKVDCQWSSTSCPNCQGVVTLKVPGKKESEGRRYLKCGSCGHFEWFAPINKPTTTNVKMTIEGSLDDLCNMFQNRCTHK